jgi:hypothetical protein
MKICKGKKKPAGRKSMPSKTQRRLPIPTKRNKDSKAFGKLKRGGGKRGGTGLASTNLSKMAREGQILY